MPSLPTTTARTTDEGAATELPMTLGVREATEEDVGDWSAFVASRPEADVLQSWAWGEAGQADPGESWSRIVVTDGGGLATVAIATVTLVDVNEAPVLADNF